MADSGTLVAPGGREHRDLRHNLTLDLVTAVGVGMTTSLVVTLLPTVARREGLGPIGLATIAAAPFVANLLGVFAGRYGPRHPTHLAVMRALGAVLLVPLAWIAAPPILALVATGFWLSISFGVPIQLRLWGVMYPGRERGRLVGIVGTGRAAAAGLAALAGGLLADHIGGLAVVALGGAIGGACALASIRFRAPLATQTHVSSARDCLRALTSRPLLRRLALAQGFYGGGLIAAGPLFAFIQVDRLHLSLAEVGSLGIVAAASTTISFLAWGMLTDRRGGLVAMRAGSVLGLLCLLAYAFAPSVAVLWVAAFLIGLANAAIDMGLAAVMSEQTPLEERAAALAGWNGLTGARGVAAPFIATSLLAAGMVSLTGALLLCAVTCAVGSWLYVTAGAETRPKQVVVASLARVRAWAT